MVAVVSIVGILASAATALLRPLVRQLGAYLEALTRQKQGSSLPPNDAVDRIEVSLLAVQEELAKLREEREFLAQLYPLVDRSLPGSVRPETRGLHE